MSRRALSPAARGVLLAVREDVLAQALRELADHIAEKTGCPVYLGEAPAAAKT